MSYRDQPADPAQAGSRKRARPDDLHAPQEASFGLGSGPDDSGFQHEDGEGDDDDEDDGKGKKAGRRKIKIEFIQDKSRRHITFSKRKAGIMKKAYELSTLTGTQVLLLVVSETGLVYTFTTAKLQPLVTQPEGKNLIQACLNAPVGQPPSSFPVGQPLGRTPRMPAPPPAPRPGEDLDSERSLSPQNSQSNNSGARPRRAAANNRASYHEPSESPPAQQPQDLLSPPLGAQQQPYSSNGNGSGGYGGGNGSYYPPPPQHQTLPSFPPPSDWTTSYQRR